MKKHNIPLRYGYIFDGKHFPFLGYPSGGDDLVAKGGNLCNDFPAHDMSSVV